MRDARDAEDKRLLETGEIDLLLSGWVETIRGRCVARMRGAVGEDVAQAVCERLWRELKAGKHRDGRLPFRVIVHSVIGWVCNGWYEPGWHESELFDLDGAAPDETEAGRSSTSRSSSSSRRCRPATARSRALYYLERPRARRDRRAARQEAERRVPGDQPEQGPAAGVARGMIVELETLLDELARRHARGEPLDVEGTLAAGRRPSGRARAADRGVPRARAAPRAPPRRSRTCARSTTRRCCAPASRRRYASTTSSTRSSRRARSNRTLGRRCGATTSSSRAACSTARASQRRCGTRSPTARPFARVADRAASRRSPPAAHVPGRPALRAGRDAGTVSDRRSRNRPTTSTRCSSASLRRPERTRPLVSPGTQPGSRPAVGCDPTEFDPRCAHFRPA